MSKNSENFGENFRMSKKGLEAPRTWDRCRKMFLDRFSAK